MTTNHIDQLAEWFETAEKAMRAHPGDTIIEDRRDREGGFDIRPASDDEILNKRSRILDRAPKPRPAWRDAVAVIATCRYPLPDSGRAQGVFANVGTDKWQFASGGVFHADKLSYVTPLLEARVTDEMVLRALNASTGLDLPRLTSFAWDEVEDMRFALRAALGLDPDTGGIA